MLTTLDKHNTGHRACELPALGGHLHGIDCVASVEIFACGLFRRWGGEEGLRMLRLPALRQGLHIMPHDCVTPACKFISTCVWFAVRLLLHRVSRSLLLTAVIYLLQSCP